MELKIEDLADKCPHCKGTGEEPVPEEPKGGPSFGRRVVHLPGSSTCSLCGGTKLGKLTETGKAIRDLMNHLQKNGPRLAG